MGLSHWETYLVLLVGAASLALQGLGRALAGLVDQRLQARDLGLDLGRAERPRRADRLRLARLQVAQQDLGFLDALGQLQRLELVPGSLAERRQRPCGRLHLSKPLLNVTQHAEHRIQARVTVDAERDQLLALISTGASLVLEARLAGRHIGQQEPQASNGEVQLPEGGLPLLWHREA